MTDTLPTTGGIPPATRARLPFVVPLLAVGTFLMCTTEYIVAGLLPQMAADLDVSLSQVALLITAFAIGMVVGAPVMAFATLRLPRRATLVAALIVFALGHVIAALSDTFTLVLVARIITAIVTGAFWSVASVVATTAAGPAASGRALGVMMSGVGIATIAGVPLGAFAGQLIGWRGAFWGLAVLALVVAAVIFRFAPADTPDEIPIAPRSQLAALRNGPLWVMLAATVVTVGGYMAAFSFISPLVTATGLPEWAVPLALAGYGIGALVGTNLAGRFSDRRPIGTFLVAAIAAAVIMGLIAMLSGIAPVVVVLLLLLGAAGMAIPPVATSLSVSYAAGAPTIAAGLSVSAFNAGIAVGAWVAGIALDSALGTTGPAVVGAIMAALGVIPLLVLSGMMRRRAVRSPV